MTHPVVAIVGRANVGKSTLFNKITGKRSAIVEDVPGVTRDRAYKIADWAGTAFTIIDTGGLEITNKEDVIGQQVRSQAEIAIEEADVIIFMVDAKTGVTKEDELAAKTLLRSSKPIVLAVNKVDTLKDVSDIYEFYGLGLGDPIAIAAEHGTNTGDLLDIVTAYIKKGNEYLETDHAADAVKVAVVGRPNVGKSSLVNKLIRQNRVIVTDTPGTTRDAVDILFERDEKSYLFIDTAGIRRKSRITEPTEKHSVNRALKAIDRADVVLILIDAEEGVVEQDERIAGYAHEAGKSSIIVVNKWDLIEKDGSTINKFDRYIRGKLKFMHYVPILYISALTGKRVDKLFELINFVSEQANMRVSTRKLNEIVEEAFLRHPPAFFKGRRLKIYYVTQVKVQPPTFLFFVNDSGLVHFAYRRFLENSIRKEFGFEGAPIRLVMRKR